jgi:DNA-binding beta-propeller fold protein YncE
VVDSQRQTVYVDGMSGIYPPEGFSFGAINTSSETLGPVVALPGTAGELALDEHTGTVYAAGNNSIAVYNPASTSFDYSIRLKIPVFSIAFDPSTSYLLVTSDNNVFQLDPAAGKLLRNATVGYSAQGMAIDSARGEVFVANYLSGTISVLRTTDLSSVETIKLPTPSYPSKLALNPQRGVLYSTTDEDSIVEVDSASHNVIRSLVVSQSGANGTYAVAVDMVRNRLFVAAEPGTTVVELDASTGSVLSRLGLDSAAFEMAVDQTTGKLYVTNYHQVTVISHADLSAGGQPFAQAGPLAAIVGAAIAVAVGVYAWKVTPSGGKPGGLPSQPRRDLSSSRSSRLRLPAARAR